MNRLLLAIALALLSYWHFARDVPSPQDADTLANRLTDTIAFEPCRVDADHLPNVVQVHGKVFSGGQPAGEAGFQELRDLGVRTIISVDGAKPEIETARKYGLRYVHLPHGYDGVPDARVIQLASAVRRFDGSIYIHCHHGMHRAPAAASAACVAAGLIPSTEAVSILTLAGTSPNYRGLYESVHMVRALEEALFEALKVDFPEVAEIQPLAEAMVELEHAHDRLQQITAANWRTPAAHPDLSATHEALLIREHFTELLRTDDVRQRPPEFLEFLRDSEATAQELEAALQQWQPVSTDATPPKTFERLFAHISANCTACHQKFRDVPLSEK